MEEKKYLKLGNKVGYGLGDGAANCFYSFVTSFMLIYLTSTMGMNPGIVGILIMAAKLFDGVTDIVFGFMMDRTKSKMGKARPWMLWSQLGVSACMIACFSIPTTSGASQYIFFFIFYTAATAIFYTMNTNSYQALCALITTNKDERVQLGTFRYIFVCVVALVIGFVVPGMVSSFGGGAAGWRITAIIFASIALIINTISVFSVRELPDEAFAQMVNPENHSQQPKKMGIITLVKYLLKDKYYLLCLVIQIITYLISGIGSTVLVYFATYNLGNADLYGIINMAGFLPIIFGVIFAPLLVKKIGSIQKTCIYSAIASVFFSVVVFFAVSINSFPVLLAGVALKSFCTGPLTSTFGGLLGEASEFTFRKTGERLEGAMYSCSCFGVKLGSGVGSAIAGLLLNASGFISTTAGQVVTQPASAITMIRLMYTVTPIICMLIQAFIFMKLDVEKKNKEWERSHT